MSSKKKVSRPVTKEEMRKPSEFGGDPRRRGPKAPHEVLRDLYRSDPTDPGPGR